VRWSIGSNISLEYSTLGEQFKAHRKEYTVIVKVLAVGSLLRARVDEDRVADEGTPREK
jgi:hypothetical protein